MSIPKYVESIFADTENFPAEGMTQTEIIHKILKYRGRAITLENAKKEQPNAAKALRKLLKEQRIILSDQRTYHPVTQETAQREALTQFSENVYCLKPDIFAVVDTMYLIKVHSDHALVATEYLRRYLGSDRCFDILYSTSYLWVLWESRNQSEEEFRTVYQEICDAVAISYDRYLDSQRKMRKLQQSHTITPSK